MSAEQLCFFKFERPLVERFGARFFKELPEEPAVYTFVGEREKVLYIGQTRNLRNRLSYYKNAQPEREPRRIIRLVHQTAAIQFELCPTAAAARLRELALIRQHRPRFNVAHTKSATFSFFGIRRTSEGIALRLIMTPRAEEGEELVGAFKNRALCLRALGSIARTLLSPDRGVDSAYDFPAWLNARMKSFEWRVDSRQIDVITGLLHGDADAMTTRAAELCANASDRTVQSIYANDLVTLSEFFVLARRMAELRSKHGLDVLSQEALQVTSSAERGEDLEDLLEKASEPGEPE